MKFTDVARFEFRVFGEDLAKAREAFAARGPGAVQPASRETYIVTRLNVESNVKIRNLRLEVKGLQGRLQDLEQWLPVFKTEFPVSAADVENVVAPALGLDVDLGGQQSFAEPALLAWARGQTALAVIDVDKQRTVFDFGACEAEFTELTVGGKRLQTVAVEAPEADAARACVRDAGLAAARNESYSLFLQRRLFPGSA